MMHVDTGYMLLALCLLAIAVTPRLPPQLWITWVCELMWLLAVALVLALLIHRLVSAL